MDATQAQKVKPGHMKALVRGALACVQLERFGEALQWCDEGLRVRGVRESGMRVRGVREGGMRVRGRRESERRREGGMRVRGVRGGRVG